jgi:hypothetical protein
MTSQVPEQLNPEARIEFGETYRNLLLGPIEIVLQEGILRGEIEPVHTNLPTWTLPGMAYPFFCAGHELSRYPADQAAEMMVSVFFDGLAPVSGTMLGKWLSVCYNPARHV